ncbi:polysaccharide biosynthesis tyrosine autokinase [Rivularia sp. UHCC 0363]|uniref:GumC family protein n=1 Tax=Rivularia sp. UHCC 0363 TaxID=3110244 RepID=UPI002B20D6C6|nr:polysaccharide biosynthesis tyrosine autokinase [Rivularia sp. UHCC 0363]MEA5596135.1 polysaccharide biosynthesis tyrosine autokinase [Rivularia sp. UHCC 0363]
METYSFKPSPGNRDTDYAPQLLQAQSIPWTDTEDDWDLRQFLSILKRRSLAILGVSCLVMTGVVAFTLNQKPLYESKFQILAEPVNSEESDLPKLIEGSLNKTGLDYETQIQVLKSPELMTKIVGELRASYKDIDYESLIRSLRIIRLGDTKIIEVAYQANDKVKTKTVLDKLAQAYLKYSLENRQTNLRQGVDFVEKQLPPIQERVNKIQEELQSFREKHDFLQPETQSAQIASESQLLSQQRVAANQQLAKAYSYFNSLQTQQGALAVLNDAPVYQQLISQLRELEIQIAGESTRFRENSIPIQNLREKRQKLLPLLSQEAQRVLYIKRAEAASELQNLQQQSQVLGATEQQLNKKIEQSPSINRKYTELTTQLQVATDSLNRFLATRENLQIEAAQTQIPWQLIQAPIQPEIPISPSIPRNLILGFVASAILGIGCGLLIEKLDTRYHSIEAFRENIRFPLLANIPFEKQLPYGQKQLASEEDRVDETINILPQSNSDFAKIVPHRDTAIQQYGESSRFSEAFRVLHTNLQLLSSDEAINSLVISSSMSGDGKSTVAFNLAQTASAMGRRVLLVDADMRRPQIHNLSNLSNLWGLSNLISGNMPIETAIRELPSISGLSVITAGPIPPDPIKLLSSQKMKQIIEHLHSTFDLVIYDTPPLVGLADANLLAPYTNGVVLVARIHQTDRSVMMQAVDNLKMARTNVLGMVINGDKAIKPYSYY